MSQDKINIKKEIKNIESFPDEKFIEIIREVGFECDFCGKCCTSEFNDHVFLLDEDASRLIETAGKDFIQPAPYYEFCDNLGRFYVMGYALKTRPGGGCIFYKGGRCEHYADRPAICRIFPYMLHREADENGNMEFRQAGGLNAHGLYHNKIDDKACREIVRAVKQYELGFLRQKQSFLHAIDDHFRKYRLRHSQQMYDRGIRELKKGIAIEVYVFIKGGFQKEIVSIINPE